MPQTLDQLNQGVIRAEYAVRGAVVLRAAEIAAEMQKDPAKFHFSRISYLNVGNPMACGFSYMKFTRNLIALCAAPHLLKHPVEKLLDLEFSPQAIERARLFTAANPAGLGAYTHSKGFQSVRREVANFIARRDGFPSDPEDVYLTNGASSGIRDVIKLLSGPRAGDAAFMIPVPQYPMYSATLAMSDAVCVGYGLEEENGWMLNAQTLEAVYQQHSRENPLVKIRGLVVINPNNPTGAVLNGSKTATDVVAFCARHDLVLLADEVYQGNLYRPQPSEECATFVSFKKTLREFEIANKRQGPMLVSYHSISKGYTGECGLRGGYMETVNTPVHISEQLYKIASVSLCPNSVGQLVVSVMVNPPQMDEYDNDARSKIECFERKAYMVYQILNENEHIDCQKMQGSMFAFPRLFLPDQFVRECEAQNKKADAVYCMRLLEEEGVCCVAGSGFLQKQDTWHLWLNILEEEEVLPSVLKKIGQFHDQLWKQYAKQ